MFNFIEFILILCQDDLYYWISEMCAEIKKKQNVKFLNAKYPILFFGSNSARDISASFVTVNK